MLSGVLQVSPAERNLVDATKASQLKFKEGLRSICANTGADLHEKLKEFASSYEFATRKIARECWTLYYASIADKTLYCNTTKEPKSDTYLRYSCSSRECPFYIVIKPSARNTFIIHEKHCVWKHEVRGGQCLSSHKVSINSVMSNDKAVQMIKKSIDGNGRKEKKSIKTVEAELLCNGYKNVTKDVLKKISAAVNREVLQDHVMAVNMIEPMLELIKEDVPNFEYEVERKPNSIELERILVMMPYSKFVTNSEYNCKLYGVDTCHVRDLIMKDDDDITGTIAEYVFEQLKIALLSTRTPYNHILVLGFAIVYSESTADVKGLLSFLKKNGVLINDASITILSDRSLAIAKALDEEAGDAYHALCPLHLERNLKHNGWSAHIHLYKFARRAETKIEFDHNMNKIKETCEPMYRYLTENVKEGEWECYKLYQQ